MTGDIVIRSPEELPAANSKIELMLQKATTVEEVKHVRAMVAAAITYAAKFSTDIKAEIAKLKVIEAKAAVKLGRLLESMPKNKGGLLRGDTEALRDTTPTLQEMGLSKKESSRLQKLTKLPDAVLEKVEAGEISVACALKKSTVKTQIGPKKVELLKQLMKMSLGDHAQVMAIRLHAAPLDVSCPQTLALLWELRDRLDQVLEEHAAERQAA